MSVSSPSKAVYSDQRPSTPRDKIQKAELYTIKDSKARLSSTPNLTQSNKANNQDVLTPTSSNPLNSAYMLRSPGTPSSSKKLTPTDRNTIKVIARFRPENDLEKVKTNKNRSISFISDEALKCKDETYTFDKVFVPESSQSDIFQYSVTQTVDDLFEGYNGTVLAYGQTGSGKSYTMMGADINDKEKKGLIPRIADVIFQRINDASIDTEYTLSASYMEIYLEQIKDLLNIKSKNLTITEDPINGIHVKGLSKVYVGSSQELYNVLNQGDDNRTKAATDMNEESSRSHALFQINLTQENPVFGIKRSKLFLVDLAGSEKVHKTGVTGINLEEAKKINSSLSSLGNVINALTDPKVSYVPYRDSKLTRILQESLGGNSKTSLIINCSPSSYNEAETISTLRFGTRAKKIKNKAHVNNDPSKLDLLTQIEQLKKINEEKSLKNDEILYELELWKSGVYKTEQESEDNQKETIIDPVSPDLSKGSELQIKSLNERVERLSQILTTVPSLNELNENTEVGKKLIDSQKLNQELMNDIQVECMKNVELQLKLEESNEKKSRPTLSQTESEKSFALEITLNQFAIKLEELESQNNLLRKEISMVKKISDTRNERIATLESMIQTYKSQLEIKEDQGKVYAEASYFSLRNPFSSYKKPSSNLSHSTTNNDYNSNVNTQIIPGSFPSKTNNQYIDATNNVNGNGKWKSEADLNNAFLNPSYSITDESQNLSTNGGFKGKISGSSSKRGSISSSKSGENRIGLNLHIVKPMRGGSTVIMES